MDPITVSIDGACSMLSVGRTTVYQLIRDGQLSTVHIGARHLVTTESIRRLVDAGQKAKAA